MTKGCVVCGAYTPMCLDRIAGLVADSEIYSLAYQAIGACDMSNFLAKCADYESVVEERDRLKAFCEKFERDIVEFGDPFSGDDQELMVEVRKALGKTK